MKCNVKFGLQIKVFNYLQVNFYSVYLCVNSKLEMKQLSKIWYDFVKLSPIELNIGISKKLQNNSDWVNFPEDLKTILKINNGQKKLKGGFFGILSDGKTIYKFSFLDFESILKSRKIIKEMKIREIDENEFPFAFIKSRDIGGFGFSINSINKQINYISFSEYDYNGGTVHNKGKYKYANNMIEFLENQIMLKQFE